MNKERRPNGHGPKETIAIALIVVATIIGAIWAMATDSKAQSYSSTPSMRTIPLCQSEDGSEDTLPCYWDAGSGGNGEGESFTVHDYGDRLVYDYGFGRLESLPK
jgi:hypothetical protein